MTPLTEAEYLAIYEPARRIELMDGRLRPSPAPSWPHQEMSWLLVGALRSLARREHPATLVLDAFLLRSLAVAGYAASFGDCARCGEPGPHRAFAVALGGVVCSSCRPPGAAAPDPATLQLLAALLSGDWATAEAADERLRREGSGLVAAYLQWHLERGIRSLRHVERV